jgi:hypothetical protein
MRSGPAQLFASRCRPVSGPAVTAASVSGPAVTAARACTTSTSDKTKQVTTTG